MLMSRLFSNSKIALFNSSPRHKFTLFEVLRNVWWNFEHFCSSITSVLGSQVFRPDSMQWRAVISICSRCKASKTINLTKRQHPPGFLVCNTQLHNQDCQIVGKKNKADYLGQKNWLLIFTIHPPPLLDKK